VKRRAAIDLDFSTKYNAQLVEVLASVLIRIPASQTAAKFTEDTLAQGIAL
jgi:hypothetical protein